MSDILLTAYPGSILGPIAKLLGILMDWIYSGISDITGGRVESVVLSIVIITIIIYMCLLPLTIKQQKFSKLSQKMQPEMQAIQAKYKIKKDQASMMAMQEETQLFTRSTVFLRWEAVCRCLYRCLFCLHCTVCFTIFLLI